MKYPYLFFIILHLYTYAQSQPDTSVLQDVVIYDYKAGQNTPVTYTDLSTEEIQKNNVGQEPSYIISQTPSVTIYSDAGSYQGYSYFRIRGIDQTRINMTLDGVPLNEPEDQGAYFSNYPDFFSSVSKVQIQRGVGTTQNGVASYAGSILFSSPELLDSSRFRLGANYGSYNTYRTFGEYNSGLKQRKALYVRTSHLHTDGYKYHSGNAAQSVFVSGGWYRDLSIWKLVGFAGLQKNELAWLGVDKQHIDKDPRINANTKERDRFFQSMIQLQNHWFVSKQSKVRSTLYYNSLNGNYDFDMNNFLGLPSTGELFNYALKSQFLGFFSTYSYETPHLKLTSGIHANTYTRKHVGSVSTQGQLYTNRGLKNELSAFSKINYEIFNKLSYYLDIQLRYCDFSYRGSIPLNKMSWAFFNPKTGVSYVLNKHISMYYSIGQTSREPTRNDMFGGEDDLSSNLLLSEIAVPEKLVDQELGIRVVKEKYQITGNVYYMDFNNEIVLNGQVGPNGLPLTSNVEKSYRAGIEGSFKAHIHKHITYMLNTSYNYSVITVQNTRFSPVLTPKILMNSELDFKIKKKWQMSLDVRYQSSSFIDFANSESIKEFLITNTRLAFAHENFEIALRVNNILNTQYFAHGYVDTTPKYFVQAPRNINIAITFNY